MTKRGTSTTFCLLTSTVVLACALAACEGEKRAEPPQGAQPQASAGPAEPVRTKEQAMTALMELPEVKAWSAQIEKKSRGKAHGAVIEDDPEPRVINGKKYWQLSFVENRAEKVSRRESFLVSQTSDDILIDDTESDTVLSLDEWRRGIERVELKAN
jgi:hypothetical protein